MTRTRFPLLVLLALAALAAGADPLPAADGGPLLASGYWTGFKDFWVGMFKKQNGIVMFVLGMGAVSLFIITRGKWKK